MEHNHKLRSLAASGPEAIASASLTLFGIIAFAVTVVAVVESYSNLLAFAAVHHMTGWRMAIAPLVADSFIVMGELLLFAYILKRWDSGLAFATGCSMAVWGFLLSVGGNVWHVPSASPVDKALGAIWPITATAGMAGSLIILKLIMNGRGSTGMTVVPAAAVQEPPPAPHSQEREPRQVAPGRAARTAELAAASDHEQAVVLRLVTSPGPLPGRRVLAASDFNGSIRKAERVLKLARAGMNGAGSGNHNGS